MTPAKREVLTEGKRHKHRMRRTNPNLPDMWFCTDKFCAQSEKESRRANERNKK